MEESFTKRFGVYLSLHVYHFVFEIPYSYIVSISQAVMNSYGEI